MNAKIARNYLLHDTSDGPHCRIDFTVFHKIDTAFVSGRFGILLETLTLYLINLYKMTEAQVKELNQQLPEPERDWIDAIPDIFGRKWKKEGLRKGRAQGRAEGQAESRAATTHAITIKTIQKFPDWSDAEIAKFVGIGDEFVEQVRRELVQKK